MNSSTVTESDKFNITNLKDKPNHLDLLSERSDTIYFRGISPRVLSDENCKELLSIV